MKKKAKQIVALATALAFIELFAPKKYKEEVEVEISLEEEDLYFAKYRNGLVYIGSEEFIESIKDKVNENDVLIIDKRNIKDPDFQVLNSYRIKDRKERDDIIYIIQTYNILYPLGNWDRSSYSMRNEWEIHNMLYHFQYSLEHTTDVDFDNDDEKTYKSKILTNILHN